MYLTSVAGDLAFAAFWFQGLEALGFSCRGFGGLALEGFGMKASGFFHGFIVSNTDLGLWSFRASGP